MAAPIPAPDLTSTGVGTALQSVKVTIPTGDTVQLLNFLGNPTASPYTPPDSSGTYTLDPTTGVLSYLPSYGYLGAPFYTAGYRITDVNDRSGSGTYTPTVMAPPAPTPPPLTSAGGMDEPQTATAEVPPPTEVSGVTLLDAGGQPSKAESVTVVGGVYTMDTESGEITFTPTADYSGNPVPVTYQETDGYGQKGTNTYSPSVVAPPVALPLTSRGVGTARQSVTVPVPDGGSALLFDGDAFGTTVTLPGHGTFVIDPDTGLITFTPVLGFSGETEVDYGVGDAYDQADFGTYTATVAKPPVPTAAALRSSGTGTALQKVTVIIPSGGTARLMNGDTPATTVTVPGQGTFVLDPGSGAITFTPLLGFSGAAGLNYVLSDAYGQSASARHTATVAKPPAPTAAALRSSGTGTAVQTVTVAIPAGATLRLLSGTALVTSMTVAGQGTYTLDPSTGVIAFTALAGFAGSPAPVTYQLTDAYGQTATALYQPTVIAVPTVFVPTTTLPTQLPNTGASIAGPTGLGLLLLLLGAAMTVAGRRRRGRTD